LAIPLTGVAAFRQQDYVLNGGPNRNAAAYFEDARHGLALHDAAIRIGCNRRNVMSQKNAFLTCCPRQKRFVASSCHSDILRSHNIEIVPCGEQRAKDVIIEILVAGQRNTPTASAVPTIWRESRPDATGIRLTS
jgi:hypothetical protein